MKSKINVFKKTVCFMVILVLMLGSQNFTAFAAHKEKTVTYKKTYTYHINQSAFPDYYNSPKSHVPATYSYNDGTYKGTLKLTRAVCGTPKGIGNNLLEINIYTEYSGTVTHK